MVIKWLSVDDLLMFIVLYFMEIDLIGCLYGFGMLEVKVVICNFDVNVMGYFLDEFWKIDLFDKVNIIFILDYGMIFYNISNFVDFDVIVNVSIYEIWFGNVVFVIIELYLGEESYVYENFKDVWGKILFFEVYKKEDVFESFYFKYNRWIGFIVIIMKEGWYIWSLKILLVF